MGNVERTNSDLPDSPEVATGDLCRLRGTVAGERDGVIDGIVDLVFSDNTPETVNLVDK
jgi:hypothetical protein